MDGRYILTDYLASALSRGNYERLEDGSYAGTIRECPGVVAFGTDLNSCKTSYGPRSKTGCSLA